MEEVADNAEMIVVMESNQVNGAACSRRISHVPFHSRFKHGKAPFNAAKRMKKISSPKTLYGAGKRKAMQRSVGNGIPNPSVCRFRAGMKRKFATPSDLLPKKKMVPLYCIVQSRPSSESSYVSSSNSYVEFLASRNIVSGFLAVA